MKTLASLLLITIFSITSFAQGGFEKGYLIDKSDKKIECFIKNTGWDTNPSEISYKLTLSDKAQQGDLTNVKEFGIDNKFKYINAHVKIDRSTKATPGVNALAPVWNEEDLFLKVVLEGKASLYEYVDRKIVRFFYALDNKAITPLIYKEVQNGNTLSKNTDYRQQIWDKIRVQKATFELIKSINYTTADLVKYFENYNKEYLSKS